IETYPVLDYLQGSANWDADISVVKKSARIIITSNLQGISSSFPQPFAKRANEVMLLRVEKNPVLILPKQAAHREKCAGPCPKVESSVAEGQDVITARLGNLLSARLERQNEGGAMMIKRGTVSFGTRDKSPVSKKVQKLSRGKDGVWLVGDLPELSVEGWGNLAGGAGKAVKNNDTTAGVSTIHSVKPPNNAGQPADYGSALPIAGANLHIGKLTGYGQSFSALHVTAARRGDGLAARLSGSGLNGEVVWEPHGYETGSMFRARLSNLQWAGEELPKPPLPLAETIRPAPVKTEQAGKTHPGDVPALDISIENLQIKGKHIGRFELIGHPENKDWRLRRLNITNPDGSLVGDGVWSDAQGQLQTQLNLTLDISDAGKILGRSGYPNTVKGGSGRLVADLSWAGTPDEFSSATLNGSLKLDTGKGQFLKMDPGAGKLLSVLSLQDLPKHIALGFTDVFSEGFQFDNINGNATIKNGVIESQDFRIYGSSAKVTLKGSVDLKNETQNLTVRILPTLGDSVSLIGAFAISPVVGIGSLIVNKILGNPLDKLASFEYNVTGSWRDPSVVKVGGFAAEIKQGNQDK
ncbi:MAG TPA: AsmA-like C-terminal region-containing protein, partial [Gallionella sp.]